MALLGLAYFLRDQLAETLSNLSRVNLLVLLLIIPLQLLNFFAQAKLYQSLFRVLGERFRTRPMYRLALELSFVNNVFPSGGVSGFSYIALRLRSEGISTAKATLVQMLKFITVFLSFQAMLFVGLLMLALGGRANDFMLLVAGMIGTFVFMATFGLAFIIGSKRRINAFFTFIAKILNYLIGTILPKNKETINIERAKQAFTELHENYMKLRRDLGQLRRPLSFALLFGAVEVMTIYVVYLAFGQIVNPGAIILAYAVANFAGLVSILPGGIGIYEALMTAVLAGGGISAAVSLPVTVMYRVINISLQLPPGYYFYHRTLHEKPEVEKSLNHDG